MEYSVVRIQLHGPTKKSSRASASSSGESFYFIYTYQVEYAISNVDIKAKLALRGTAPAKQGLKDRAIKRRAARGLGAGWA
jgi:hypothetical protein